MTILALIMPSLLLAGIAGAHWTNHGAGTGAATTGTAQPITLGPATPVAGLYPASRADVVLTATNPNSSPAVITALRLDSTRGTGGFAVDADHAGCATSALSYTTQTNGGAGWTAPATTGASQGTLSIRLRDALAMAGDASDACQGATITVYLAAGP